MTRRWFIAGALLVLIAVMISVVSYGALPATVTTHWDLSGTPNGWSSRAVAASIVPLIMLVVLITTATFARSRVDESSALPLIVFIGLAGVLCFHGVMLGLATGRISSASAPRICALVLSLMLIAIGNYLPRAGERNPFVGVRLPWAFSSADTWKRSQRLGGYGLVAAGIIGLAAVILVPSWSLPTVVVALVVQTIYVSIASYRIAHSAD
jgi:Predicted integral membrane protein